MFISFNADEIHALRVELAEKLNALPPEEAVKMFNESVTRAEEAIAAQSLPLMVDSRATEAI